MMLAEVKPPLLDTGGKSCKFCKFWSPYTEEQKEILALAGKDWGRCTNQAVYLQAQIGMETGKFTDYVDVQKAGYVTIVSTYANYNCANYKGVSIKDDKKDVT